MKEKKKAQPKACLGVACWIFVSRTLARKERKEGIRVLGGIRKRKL